MEEEGAFFCAVGISRIMDFKENFSLPKCIFLTVCYRLLWLLKGSGAAVAWVTHWKCPFSSRESKVMWLQEGVILVFFTAGLCECCTVPSIKRIPLQTRMVSFRVLHLADLKYYFLKKPEIQGLFNDVLPFFVMASVKLAYLLLMWARGQSG